LIFQPAIITEEIQMQNTEFSVVQHLDYRTPEHSN